MWFGDQGFEYLDLGRFWQVLLAAGLFCWVTILFRGLRGRLEGESKGNLPWLFFFSALSIPAFYAVGLLAHPSAHFTTTDFWRFWVVHLWVEDFLELFTTIMVAYLFVLLGIVEERVALTMVYLDILLYSAGGVIGTMHHVYFSGEPAVHMALGAFFSAAEVIPLTFLTLEAWSFLQLGVQQGVQPRSAFPHLWAVMFLAAVGFWNFLGAGIFGFLINLPIVSYYEIGTALTANHCHAAMMGVYGMLVVSLMLFCLRYVIPTDRWPDRAAKISFWCLNLGLLWMVFAALFPPGVLQLYHSVSTGYFDARSLAFQTSGINAVIEWLWLPGDAVFLVGGVLPVVYLSWVGCGIRARRSRRRSQPRDYLRKSPRRVRLVDVPLVLHGNAFGVGLRAVRGAHSRGPGVRGASLAPPQHAIRAGGFPLRSKAGPLGIPVGEKLYRAEIDYALRIVRYPRHPLKRATLVRSSLAARAPTRDASQATARQLARQRSRAIPPRRLPHLIVSGCDYFRDRDISRAIGK
jgi:nitric oxide reductase subunit B